MQHRGDSQETTLTEISHLQQVSIETSKWQRVLVRLGINRWVLKVICKVNQTFLVLLVIINSQPQEFTVLLGCIQLQVNTTIMATRFHSTVERRIWINSR